MSCLPTIIWPIVSGWLLWQLTIILQAPPRVKTLSSWAKWEWWPWDQFFTELVFRRAVWDICQFALMQLPMSMDQEFQSFKRNNAKQIPEATWRADLLLRAQRDQCRFMVQPSGRCLTPISHLAVLGSPGSRQDYVCVNKRHASSRFLDSFRLVGCWATSPWTCSQRFYFWASWYLYARQRSSSQLVISTHCEHLCRGYTRQLLHQLLHGCSCWYLKPKVNERSGSKKHCWSWMWQQAKKKSCQLAKTCKSSFQLDWSENELLNFDSPKGCSGYAWPEKLVIRPESDMPDAGWKKIDRSVI